MGKYQAIDDDGLVTPEIGAWCEDKYRMVALYSSLFAKSMRNKWECLVYIDLFSVLSTQSSLSFCFFARNKP
ncbi:MAG: hypothetical protein C4581_06710 [Nitrospiraceae bacterium]|nr:MAG: hypothetical protein C4581_06710 [Nitrospiraceae bacterium]